MDGRSLLPLLLSLVIGAPPSHSQSTLVVRVDPSTGNDSLCMSAQERRSPSSIPGPDDTVPCATINRALGDVSCVSCANPYPIQDTVVQLAAGVHRLSGCIGITDSEGVRIVAETNRQATIECAQSPDSKEFDNLFVCEVRGIAFRGIVFEKCGPLSPNVFLNSSSNITFEDCIFRLVPPVLYRARGPLVTHLQFSPFYFPGTILDLPCKPSFVMTYKCSTQTSSPTETCYLQSLMMG